MLTGEVRYSIRAVGGVEGDRGGAVAAGTDGVDLDPEGGRDLGRHQRLRLADIVAAVGEQDHDPAPARQPAHHLDGAQDRIADGGAVLEREVDDLDPLERPPAVPRGRAWAGPRCRRSGRRSPCRSGRPRGRAPPSGPPRTKSWNAARTTSRPVGRAITQHEVHGAHAAGDVDHHGDARCLPAGCGVISTLHCGRASATTAKASARARSHGMAPCSRAAREGRRPRSPPRRETAAWPAASAATSRAEAAGSAGGAGAGSGSSEAHRRLREPAGRPGSAERGPRP